MSLMFIPATFNSRSAATPPSLVPYDDNVYASEVAESSDPNSYDTDVQDWIDRVYAKGGSISIAKKAIAQTIVTFLKGDSSWTELEELHIPGLTVSFLGSDEKLKYTTTSYVSYTGVFGGCHSYNGLVVGGGKYVNTNYNPSALGLSTAQSAVIFSHLSEYNTTEAFLFGCGVGTNRFGFSHLASPYTARAFVGDYNNGYASNFTAGVGDKVFGIMENSATSFDVVTDSVHVPATITARSAALPNLNIFIGALNEGNAPVAATYFVNYKGWFMATGLTPTQFDAIGTIIKNNTTTVYSQDVLPSNLTYISFDPTDQLLRVYEGSTIGALSPVATSYLNAPSGKSQRDGNVIKYNGWYWKVTSNVDLGGFYFGSPNFALSKSLDKRNWIFVDTITTSAIPTALTFAPQWFIQDGNLDVIYALSESAVLDDFRHHYTRITELSDTPVYNASVAITGSAIAAAGGAIDGYMHKRKGSYYFYYSKLAGGQRNRVMISNNPYTGFDFTTSVEFKECSLGGTAAEAPEYKVRGHTHYFLYDNYADTGMKCRYSTDNGVTWSAETHLSNGGNTIRHGCLMIDY